MCGKTFARAEAAANRITELLLGCQLLFLSVLLYVHRDLRTIRGEEPRTATSTFTQLLNSEASFV